MSIIELLKIEFMKVKRSMILPLLLIPPILVVISGVSSISMYMTPEYTDAWSAMFIQSALLFGYYLLPFSTTTGTGSTISLFPFIPCAVIISALALYVSIKCFGRKEMR